MNISKFNILVAVALSSYLGLTACVSNEKPFITKLPTDQVVAGGDLIVYFNDGVTKRQKKVIARKYGMTLTEHTLYSIFSSKKGTEALQKTKKLLEHESIIDIVEYNGIATIN